MVAGPEAALGHRGILRGDRTVGGEDAGKERVLACAAAWQPGELGRQRHDAIGELVGQFGGNAGVAQGEPADRSAIRCHGGCVRQVGFGAGIGDEGQVAVASRIREDDRVRGAAVEALVDGPHPAGRGDLQQPDVDEHVDVVGDRAAWLADPFGQLGHGHRPLEHEVEDQGSQRIADGLETGGGVGTDRVVEVVAEVEDRCDVLYVRHFSNDRE